MRTVTTRQDACNLAKEELNYLDGIKNDPTKLDQFLKTLQAEKLIHELIALRYANK